MPVVFALYAGSPGSRNFWIVLAAVALIELPAIGAQVMLLKGIPRRSVD